jgi:hypothetical protein
VALTRPSRIRVSIDRLVLHGVDRADAAAVHRALVGEIASRLGLADPSAIAGHAGRDRLQLTIDATQDAAGLGRAAGGVVADALGGVRPGNA